MHELLQYYESKTASEVVEESLLVDQYVVLLSPCNVLRERYNIGCHCGEGITWTTRIEVTSALHNIVVVKTYWSHLSAEHFVVETN